MHFYTLIFILFVGTALPQMRDTTNIERKRPVADAPARTGIQADSTLAADSLAANKIIKRDTLKPVNQRALNYNSYFIDKKLFWKTNYKTMHDIAENYPLSFNQDLGFAVHPNGLFLNGAGVNNTAYLFDGVEATGDMSWFNPLFIQTENTDSVEIITSARSFLYGINNPAGGMNILTKNRVDRAPFTRLRYHEGPFKEGTLDAQYSSIVFRKFVLSFDLTSKKAEDVVRKWNSSIWLGNAKLKYFADEKLNIIASYDYRNYRLSLTGGVDAGALDTLPHEADKTLEEVVYNTNTGLLYDNVSYNKESLHSFTIKALSTYIDNGYTDLSLYYRSVLNEYRQNEFSDASAAKIPKCVVDIRTKTLGAKLRQVYNFEIFNLDAAADYKIVKYDTNRVILSNWKSSYSVGGKLSAKLFDGSADISVFGKSAYNNGFSLNGAGADITLNVNNNISVYFGASAFNSLMNDHSSDTGFLSYYLGYWGSASKINSNVIEGGVKYSDALVMLNAKAVYRKENSAYDYFGAGFNAVVKYWKLQFENTTSYNDKPYTDNLNYENYTGSAYFLTSDILPRFQVSTGFYYKDVLFDSNLDLKTGINTRFTSYRREPGRYYYNLFKQNVFTVNFELEGEIQKTAILYFAWENLFNTKYFIIPFYPMPQQIIRFGVSWNFLN